MGSEYSFTAPDGTRSAPIDVREGIDGFAGAASRNTRPPAQGGGGTLYGGPRSITERAADQKKYATGEISWFEYKFREATGYTGYGDIAAVGGALLVLKLAKVL